MYRKESTLHPHVQDERSEEFHAWSAGSTEIEYRDLVVAVANSLKPRQALEAGILHAWGIPALAAVCDQLDVIDSDPRACNGARLLGLPNVRVHQAEATAWISEAISDVKYDFVFLDTHLPYRVQHLEALVKFCRLAPKAVVMIHDTSRLRTTCDGIRDPDSVEFWRLFDIFRTKTQVDVIELPLSRGMLLVQCNMNHGFDCRPNSDP